MPAKKKKQAQQNIRAKWIYWAVALFAIVIIVLVNIGFLSTKKSRAAIEDKLNGEIGTYAVKVGSAIENAVHEATGAAAIISSEGLTDDEAMLKYAKAIVDNSQTVYLAVVTDAEGMGYASTGDAVNISTKDYCYNGIATQYVYTPDEGILNKPAFVVAVPVMQEGAPAGYVYLYEDVNAVYRFLPTKSYGTGLGLAIVGPDGSIISSTGANSHFNSGDNFCNQLSDAELTGLNANQARLKIGKASKTYFQASYGKEVRTIVTSPIGANDWEIAFIINQSYVNSVIKKDMSAINRMIIITIIVLCILVVLLAAVFMLNKFRHNEESKGLEDKADTDLLTGVNNKIATERKIQEYMTENPDTQSLMFLFDIDNFKKINDTMGHSFGDEVLRTLGHQLTNEFRMTDIIGRLGGDEFAVFLKNIKNDEQLEREGQRLTALFHQFKAGDYVKYSATASIGAVVFPRDAKDFVSAYKAADKALYEAKRRGKNQLVFYSDDIKNVKSIRADDIEE